MVEGKVLAFLHKISFEYTNTAGNYIFGNFDAVGQKFINEFSHYSYSIDPDKLNSMVTHINAFLNR